MTKQLIGSEFLAIKKSKNGKGLFAKKNFITNEKVIDLKGELITCDEDDDLDDETRSNTIRFSRELFLSPKGEVGNFINHSCNPNSKIIKKKGILSIITIHSILKGDEITFDYSTILALDDIWRMNCNCNDKACRKIVKSFYLLPIAIKRKYIKNNMVPKHILNIK
jgi:SET domain-containing protein